MLPGGRGSDKKEERRKDEEEEKRDCKNPPFHNREGRRGHQSQRWTQQKGKKGDKLISFFDATFMISSHELMALTPNVKVKREAQRT